MKKFKSSSERKTRKIGRFIAKKLRKGDIVCLNGPLGAGKTLLTKAIAGYFGINEDVIKSPTYTYLRLYTAYNGIKIYHYDLYRIEVLDDYMKDQINEYFTQKDTISLIEWPQKIMEIIPQKIINIEIEPLNEKKRHIKIQGL